jgi:tRNA pseudouridine38-40 synthase
MRIALGVEYDGSGFAGWQIQPGTRTVQGCVEQALSEVAAHPVEVVCAGRTDAGVHARGQVVHMDTTATRTPRSWVLGTNANLPRDVSVTWAVPVDSAFHARFSARRRRYRYVILDRMVRPALGRERVCWTHRPLDAARMAAAAVHLLGEHDFSSFRALACQARHAVRTVYRVDVTRQGALVLLDVEANAFLHHMVRNIAGVLLAVGRGDREPGWVGEVLKACDRAAGGVTAPASGLYLTGVDYPEHFRLPPPPQAALVEL